MTKTAQDLAEHVLLELGKADAADPGGSADDVAFVKERYAGIWQELDDHDIAFWDENAIPDRVFDPLVQYMAFRVRKAFGTEYSMDDAYTRLVAMGGQDSDGYPVFNEYF